jgi:nucleotide sugar dehydrogenase
MDFSLSVSSIMEIDPITLPSSLTVDQVIPEIHRRVRASDRRTADFVRFVPVLEESGRVATIYDYFELASELDYRSAPVTVIGLGFVGLPLAAYLATRGHPVTGVDLNDNLVAELNQGICRLDEPGLEDMFRNGLNAGRMHFKSELNSNSSDVYVVAVGTPIDENGKPDLSALEASARNIGKVLKSGDLVIIRSTVPVGTTRGFFAPILETESGLVAGEDFFVSFAPERTAEGRVVQELRTLPQIVGGYSSSCLRRSSGFWSTVSASQVQMETLEGAELVKLANNTFRDLSFAFSNELALLADNYNVDAFEIVRAANEGYPRNPISMPSPGVGGYCLSKDPLLYSASIRLAENRVALGNAGRAVNGDAALYPVSIVKRFAKRMKRPVEDVNVLIVGIAFKGEPETADLRGSSSLTAAAALVSLGVQVSGWDAVVSLDAIEAAGVQPVSDLATAVSEADAVLILNNHRDNVPDGIFVIANPAKEKLVFDGWNQLDKREIEQLDGYVYATMGYMTPAE